MQGTIVSNQGYRASMYCKCMISCVTFAEAKTCNLLPITPAYWGSICTCFFSVFLRACYPWPPGPFSQLAFQYACDANCARQAYSLTRGFQPSAKFLWFVFLQSYILAAFLQSKQTHLNKPLWKPCLLMLPFRQGSLHHLRKEMRQLSNKPSRNHRNGVVFLSSRIETFSSSRCRLGDE